MSAFEHVPEASWEEAKEMLYGTQSGTRVLVWSNYDLVSLTRVYYISEKVGDMIARRTEIDHPLPVYWDEETSVASRRLHEMNTIIDNNCFGEFEHHYPVIQDDTGWESDSVNSEEEAGEEEEAGDDTSSVEAVDAREYLERQFEQFLYDVDEEYQTQIRETFENNIDRIVETLRSQR
jgi:hypothetical protein